jgi:hypothetical protein
MPRFVMSALPRRGVCVWEPVLESLHSCVSLGMCVYVLLSGQVGCYLLEAGRSILYSTTPWTEISVP